ncbi:hypothetical protein FEP93_05637 [Burkholderia multivorans]|nr:hypothetical protein [Burkholderia multivorans]
MVAIRDNETLAESLGIPTWTYKLVVFMLSAFFAGMGGSLYAHYMTVVSPLMFQLYYSTTILVIVLGGGIGRLAGPVIGSILFVAMSEALRITPELRMIIYGIVLLVLVFSVPNGFAPILDRGLERIARTRLFAKGGAWRWPLMPTSSSVLRVYKKNTEQSRLCEAWILKFGAAKYAG